LQKVLMMAKPPAKELCPRCGRYTFDSFIDPNVGGFVRCSRCGYVSAEADIVEDDGPG
jgi:ribosomal protein L37E